MKQPGTMYAHAVEPMLLMEAGRAHVHYCMLDYDCRIQFVST